MLTKLLARPRSTSASYLAKRNSTRSRDSERARRGRVRDPALICNICLQSLCCPLHHNESHPCQTQPATIPCTDAAREIQEETTERLHRQHQRAAGPNPGEHARGGMSKQNRWNSPEWLSPASLSAIISLWSTNMAAVLRFKKIRAMTRPRPDEASRAQRRRPGWGTRPGDVRQPAKTEGI